MIKFSDAFPFCYSLVKCYYNSENIELKNYRIICDKSLKDVCIKDGCLYVPEIPVHKNSIKIINCLILAAKQLKGNIDQKEFNNFYSFSIGLSNYIYESSYFKNTDLERVNSSINLETCFLPSNLFYNYIIPVCENIDCNQFNVSYDKNFSYDMDEDLNLSLLNMHSPIGDFCILDSLISKHGINNKIIFTKFLSDRRLYSVFSNSITDFYQDNFNFSLFIFLICMKYDINFNFDYSSLYENSFELKTANKFWESPFWIFGLIEKMLEPSRGPDYSVKKAWDPYVKQVYSLIEQSRKDSKISGATMEFMLRAIDSRDSQKPELIEKVLEDIRYD